MIGQAKSGMDRRSVNPSLGHKPSVTLNERELSMNSQNIYNLKRNEKKKYTPGNPRNEQSQMSGEKSFNVYKKSEQQSQISRLRQSNSFYQVNDKESMENLYKNSKFLPTEKNQSFTQGTNHHLSSSLNLGNNVEFQNYLREQGGLDRSMNNYYLANLRRRRAGNAKKMRPSCSRTTGPKS